MSLLHRVLWKERKSSWGDRDNDTQGDEGMAAAEQGGQRMFPVLGVALSFPFHISSSSFITWWTGAEKICLNRGCATY